MFMRYLGGGIGHLEQFSTDNDGDEEPAIQSDDYEEIEKDFLVAETCQDEEDGGEDEEGEGDGDDDDDDEEGEEGEGDGDGDGDDDDDDDDDDEDEDEDTGTLY